MIDQDAIQEFSEEFQYFLKKLNTITRLDNMYGKIICTNIGPGVNSVIRVSTLQ